MIETTEAPAVATQAEGESTTATPACPHAPDPLRDVLRLRWWVRIGVYAAIFASEPFYWFVVGYTPVQMLAGLCIGLLIAFCAIEGAFSQIIKLRKRSAYPNALLVEVERTDDSSTAASRGLEVTGQLLKAAAGVIALVDGNGALKPAAAHGLPAERAEDIISNSQGEIGRAMETLTPQVVALSEGAAFHRAFGLMPPGTERIVFAPVTALGRATGALVLALNGESDGLTDRQLLADIGMALGLSLENLRQRDELLASREQLRSVVTGAPLVIWALDRDGVYTLVEGRALETIGLRPEQVLGRSAFDLWKRRPQIMDDLRRVYAGEEVTHILKLGDVWLESRLTPVKGANGAVDAVIGVAVDVTGRRAAEAALEESERRLRTVVSNVPMVLFAVDRDGEFTLSEGKGLTALGLRPGEVVGQSAFDMYKEAPAIQANLRRALAGETVTDTVEAAGRYWDTIYSPVLDAAGQVTGVIGVATDVTERARAQDELRASEERYRELVENASHIIFSHDLSGRLISANETAERLLGYPMEEIVGMEVSSLVAPEYRELADRMTAVKLEEGGGRTTYEMEVIGRDGRRIPIEVSSWLAYEQGKPVAVHGIARDISDRRRAEAALQRRDAVLEALSFAASRFLSDASYHESMAAVLARLGEATGVSRVYVFENHRGPGGELLASQRFEWVAEGVSPQIDNPELQGFPYVAAGFERWVRMMEKGQPVVGPVREFPEPEREVLEPQDILSLATVPIFVGGEWWGFIGFDDCAEERAWSPAEVEALRAAGQLIGAAIQRVRAERAVRESEERYRELVENSNEIIYTLDVAGNITYISPAVERLGGYSPDELVGRHAFEFIHPEDQATIAESFKRVLAGELEPSEYRLRKKSGEYVWVQTSSRLVYDGETVAGIRGLIVDIDQRKKAEDALRESEDRYRDLFDNASDIVYTLDMEGRFTSINKAAERLTGYTQEEAIGKEIAVVVPPEHLERSADMRRRKMDEGGQTTYEIDIITKDGRRLPLEVSTRLIFRNGKPVGVHGIARDIGARKRAEEALRESEELYRTLVETSPDAVTLSSAEGKIVKANARAAELLGFQTPEELIGLDGYQFIDEEQRAEILPKLRESISQGIVGDVECWLVRRDGRRVPCEISVSAVTDASGSTRGFVSVVRDVSLRKRMSSTLAGEKQVLEAIASGSGLTEVLSLLTRVIEEQAEGMVCSVLLADDSSQCLRLGAAPSLPDEYNQAVDGVPIGPNAGSCGTAAYRKELVVVTDIAQDPLWADFRDSALAAGLRSCWSLPILSTKGEVVGTFAMYYREPRTPTDEDIELIKRASHIAGIAIERKRSEEALQTSEERYRNLVDTARDAIYTLGIDGSITSLNPAFTAITGWKREDWLGKNFAPIVHPEDLAFAFQQFKDILDGNSPPPYELRILCADGQYLVGEFISTPLIEKGRLKGVFGIARDITERKRAEATIRRLAYHDSLTDLPNRALFEDRLTVALAHARRTGQKLAVMFLDLDRFKTVNDTVGHGAGDQLLKSVAEDLKSVLRESDTVARFGGDEFAVLLPEISGEEHAVEVAQRILDVLRVTRPVDGQEFGITTSIGITLYPQDGADAETLLRNADTAMYRAKDQGRDSYQLYKPAMNVNVLQRLSLENDLRHAVQRGELVLHYQPIAETATGRVAGVEALVRWKHRERGLVAPDDFIPFAEESGLIIPIGEWVLREAVRQNHAWQKAGRPPIRVSVNLSGLQLQQGDLAAVVAQALQESGLSPEHLELEITEGAVMKNVDAAVGTLLQLTLMGVSISLDDFGTGYSSLSYLKRFPINSVKIDRSFVRDIATDPNDAAIVTTVIAMARNLNLKIIAEGVETAEQLEFLKRRGCDEFQGYLLSRPVAARAIPAFLAPPRRQARITRLRTA